MTRFNLLACLFAVSLGVTACSSGDEGLKLGSRDDIIIMNNGVPVDGSPAPTAMASAEDMPAMPAAEVDLAATEPAAEPDAEMVAEEAQAMAEEKATEVATQEVEEAVEEAKPAMMKAADEAAPVVTEAQDVDVAPAKVAVETKAEEVVETVEQPKEEAAEAEVVIKSSNPEIMKRVTMKGIQPKKDEPALINEGAEKATKPVQTEEVTMNDAAVETTTEEMAAEENVEEAKVEGGCYKQVVIPAVIGVDGKVAELPKLDERRVMCAKDMNSSIVAIVQQALISEGYKIGAPDGEAGEKTIAALEEYQKKNGLGMGGFTYETLKHLNIKPE